MLSYGSCDLGRAFTVCSTTVAAAFVVHLCHLTVPCIVNILDYLFNFGKAATEQVAKTAKQFRETVEEKVTKLSVKLYLI